MRAKFMLWVALGAAIWTGCQVIPSAVKLRVQYPFALEYEAKEPGGATETVVP